MKTADPWLLYRHMLRSRLFEKAVTALWNQGLISGEMHLGTGEEAIVAGTVLQLEEGDAMALDHRGTPAMLMRGVDPLLLLREFLGRSNGLCAGRGGHMHLFSPEHLAASSGIVGSAGPAAVGFALAGQRLRPGSLSLAFFGEGALNQGMLMESMNLAAAWQLPVLFICKDNGWSITTPSDSMTGGTPLGRAQGFGLPAREVDGADVEAVWQAGGEAADRARDGGGPSFIQARCRHFEGHFLGYQALRLTRRPLGEMGLGASVLRSMSCRKGASLRQRVESLAAVSKMVSAAREESNASYDDPLLRARPGLTADPERLAELEASVQAEIEAVIEAALRPDDRPDDRLADQQD